MKKLMQRLSLLLLLLSVFSLCFADNVFKGSDYELGLSKKLLMETARILENNDNILIIDEIYGYDWYYKMDTDTSLPYLNNFRNAIDKFRSIEERKDFMEYLNEQSKAMQIAQLIPNAISVATIAFSTGDPLRSLIAVAGTALSSYTNYTTSKQQQEIKLIEEEFELNQEAKEQFNILFNDMFNYISVSMEKYGFENEDYASTKTVRNFVKSLERYGNAPINLINELNNSTFQRELSIFPEYWAALGTAYYETEQYDAALSCISKYESLYVKTMYHDKDYANLMMIKAYCIDKLFESSSEKAMLLSEILPIIVENGENDWPQLYYVVQMYKRIYEETNDIEYLNVAYKYLNDVITIISREYESNYNAYMDGSFINNMLDGIDRNIENNNDAIGSKQAAKKQDGIGEQQKNELDEQIKELKQENKILKKNKDEVRNLEFTFLPPDSSLLVSIAKEFLDLADFLEKETDPAFVNQKSNIDGLVKDFYSRSYLFEENLPMLGVFANYDHRVPIFYWSLVGLISGRNGDDEIKIIVPFEYMTFNGLEFSHENTKIYLLLNNFEYRLDNWTYQVEKTLNGGKQVVFTALIPDPIETGLVVQTGEVPLIRVRFDSSIILIDDPIQVSLDEPKEMLKGFIVEAV